MKGVLPWLIRWACLLRWLLYKSANLNFFTRRTPHYFISFVPIARQSCRAACPLIICVSGTTIILGNEVVGQYLKPRQVHYMASAETFYIKLIFTYASKYSILGTTTVTNALSP